jgi:hypothetical protein
MSTKRSVGTRCTLVHGSLYTGCIYRVLTPRELRNQVVNLQNIATESSTSVGHVTLFTPFANVARSIIHTYQRFNTEL